jgi:hypothetical protein
MTNVDYQDETYNIHLEIVPATVRRSMIRTLLQAQADADEQALHPVPSGNIEESALRFLHVFLYPNLIAGVQSQTGFSPWPISFEEFVSLPEQLEIPWENAVFDLNPQWKALPIAPDEKKVQKPSRKSSGTSTTSHSRTSPKK